MNTTTNKRRDISKREVFYSRQRLKNHIFQRIWALFDDRRSSEQITKKEIAARLGKDPAQVTRWLAGPGNLTLETVSDLALALGSEARIEFINIDHGTNKGAVITPISRTTKRRDMSVANYG